MLGGRCPPAGTSGAYPAPAAIKSVCFFGTFFSRGPGEREAIRPGARKEAPLSPPAQLVPKPCCREQGPRSGGGAGKPCRGGNGRTHGTRILLPSDWLCGAMGRMLQTLSPKLQAVGLLGPGALEVTLRLTCAGLSFCMQTCLIGWVRGRGRCSCLVTARLRPPHARYFVAGSRSFVVGFVSRAASGLVGRKPMQTVRLASGPGLQSIMV